MRVLIDADGCPVVGITVNLCRQYNAECIIFCDTSHEFGRYGVECIICSKGADSVDFALVNYAKAVDVVITQDFGLAGMCLARECTVFRQDGLEYTQDNIDALLTSRHISQKIRRSGGRLKGNTKRTRELDIAFESALRKHLEK